MEIVLKPEAGQAIISAQLHARPRYDGSIAATAVARPADRFAELPGSPPSDPADRIVIATACEFDLVTMKRDLAILAYGNAGHLRVMKC